MFRVPLLVALALIVAFGGGIGTAVGAEGDGRFRLDRNRSWVAFPEAQTVSADPYAKAHRARAGELLYGGAEGLAFTALTDDTGARLSAACSYDVSGMTPPARFWTLYAAAADGTALMPGAELPSAINSWTVLRAEDSRFVIHVSPLPSPTTGSRYGGRAASRSC